MAEVFGGNFLMLISSVYFLQGLGAFATYVSQFYLMRSYEETCPCMLDDSCTGGPPDGCHMGLALQPSEQTAVLTFAKLPWNYKIIYGIASDCVPIMGSHRRSYIMIAGLIGVWGFIGLGTLCGDKADTSVSLVKWLMMLTSLSTALCDVCTDALVAANAKLESETGAGNLQSLCWASYAVGAFCANMFAGNIYNLWPSTRPCFLLCAAIPACRLVLAYKLKEPGPRGVPNLQKAKMQGRKLLKTLGNAGIFRPIAFIFLSSATIPNLNTPHVQFLTSGCAASRPLSPVAVQVQRLL
jgi:hypothetical protein